MQLITYKKPFSAQVGGTVTNITTGQNCTILTALFLNTTVTAAYVQIFYKEASSVVLGTTVADAVIPLPASAGTSIDASWGINSGANGVSFAVTTTRTGSIGATTDVFILYT